ncbi:MAG: multidrug resistance protein, MATE family [Thiomicrorhabdus sp.]|nr:MAG: multidrug resistance protein, MATE family [Thiomicrorhabdus sp.]
MNKQSISALTTESSILLRLALPILFAQLALTGLGVVDTLMSGWVGTDDLAAIGLGSSMMLPIFMISTGILLVITPLVAKAKGQSKPKRITRFLNQGLWLAVPLGFLSLIAMMNLQWVLDLLSLNTDVYQLTNDYLFYIAFGMPAIALYQALRFFWEGLGTTLPTMWISFIALLLNIPLNALFIYGYGPIEGMGAAGCGVASSLVMWAMFFIGLIYVMKSSLTKPFLVLSKALRPKWQYGLRPILSLGIPNTLALLFEVSLFSMIALFVAPLGSVVLAGHQVAINFTSLAFMVPLSIAMALTVRVGLGYGEKSIQQIRLSLVAGFMFALLAGGGLALLSYFLRIDIVSLYSDDNSVITIAASLLVFAAIYQVFDAIQVTAAGALRGFHDTKVTMVVTFISYWGIGLGLGYIFAFTDLFLPAMGVQGFWLGIVLGLTLAAILLSIRLKRIYDGVFR